MTITNTQQTAKEMDAEKIVKCFDANSVATYTNGNEFIRVKMQCDGMIQEWWRITLPARNTLLVLNAIKEQIFEVRYQKDDVQLVRLKNGKHMWGLWLHETEKKRKKRLR